MSRPPLPRKSNFGIRKKLRPVRYNTKRRTGLQAYMTELLKEIKSIKTLPAMAEFFAQPNSLKSFLSLQTQASVLQTSIAFIQEAVDFSSPRKSADCEGIDKHDPHRKGGHEEEDDSESEPVHEQDE